MAKTSAIVFGIIYVLLGIIGFFATGFVGPTGFFAANIGYDLALIIAGAVMLIGAYYATESTRTVNLVMGIILIIASLLGFAMAAGGGTMLGLLVNGADSWLNLIVGIILGASYYADRESPERMRARTGVLRSSH